jgi:hypothetical protein
MELDLKVPRTFQSEKTKHGDLKVRKSLANSKNWKNAKWGSGMKWGVERLSEDGKEFAFYPKCNGKPLEILHWGRHDGVCVLRDYISCCIVKPVKKWLQLSRWDNSKWNENEEKGFHDLFENKKTGWDMKGEWKGGVNNDIQVSGLTGWVKKGAIYGDRANMLRMNWGWGRGPKQRIHMWVNVKMITF